MADAARQPTITTIAETHGTRPFCVCVAPDGGVIFSSYYPAIRICRFDPETRSVVSLAGADSGFQDGPGATARFNKSRGVAVDSDGNIYVADCNNHRIRRIDADTRVVSTVAGSGGSGFQDGPGATAMLSSPWGVAVDGDGNIYVADFGNHRIRRIDAETMVVSTVAGNGDQGFRDGPGATANFSTPYDVAVDGDGNIYVADYSNHRIRHIDAETSVVSTVAGNGLQCFRDGRGATANFNYPCGVAVDGDGNIVVSENGGRRVRRIDGATGEVTTLAGNGNGGNQNGPAASACFAGPIYIAVDGDGNVVVSDYHNDGIKIITGLDNVAPFTFGVGGLSELDKQVAKQQAKYGRAEAKRAALQAKLVEIQAELDTATAERDREAAALATLQANVAGFRDRVAREGLDGLDETEAYEVLVLLGVTTVRPSVLVKQEIVGAVLPELTEAQMRDVLKMSRLGDRRRLTLALRRLANRQGFPPPTDGQPGAIGWGADEAGTWLREQGFDSLVDQFAAEGVDGPCLLELRPDDFKALGVATIGQGAKLKKQLERLKKVTYAGQLVQPGGGGAAAAPSAGAAAAPTIESVLEAVLQENAELQRRMSERAAEPARAAVPLQFLCPILGDVMQDPVIAMDGHTYERAAIETWFQRSDRSPMTNLAIAPVLVPNLAIRQQIAELDEL